MKKKLIALLLAILTVSAASVPALAVNTPASAPKSSVSAAVNKKKLAIQEVDFDKNDKELEVEFNCKVKFKKPKVVIKTTKGKQLKVKILEKDHDSIEVRVKGMKEGKRYTVKVSGVKAKKGGKYTSVSKKFVARDD
jgi:sporulation-control protein spo0M